MDPKKSDEELPIPTSSQSDGSTPHDPTKNVDSLPVEDLTERFSQQQVMITQLKEMVLAEETARNEKIANTRLKVEKYASQIAKIRDRTRSRQKQDSPKEKQLKAASEITPVKLSTPQRPIAEQPILSLETKTLDDTLINPDLSAQEVNLNTSGSSRNVGDAPILKQKTPSREVTKMLHQQIKEHKAIIAERTKNEKELEQALIKIQKQLEDSQSQKIEPVQHGQIKINTDVRSTIVSSETVESNKAVADLQNRIIQLESNILDLQETCKEKDSVIKSKTEAITLMSADLSKKGKNTLDLLDETKEQMQKMQENFAEMENNMKLEKQSIITELEVCKNKVQYLEEANSILESERFKLSIENTTLEERLAAKEIEINELTTHKTENMNKIQELIAKQVALDANVATKDEKGILEVAEMESLSKKIEDLEELNLTLKESNNKLQEKLLSFEETIKEKSISQQSLIDESSKLITQDPEHKDLSDVIKVLDTINQTLNKRLLTLELGLAKKENEISGLRESEEITVQDSDVLKVDHKPSENEQDFIEKIELLEHLNYSLKKTNAELHEKLSASSTNTNTKSPEKPSKPQPKGKSGPKGKAAQRSKSQPPTKPDISKNVTKTNQPKNYLDTIRSLCTLLDSLNKDVSEKELHLSQKDIEFEELNKIFIKTLLSKLATLENAEKSIQTLSVAEESESLIKVSDDTTSDIQNLEDIGDISLKDQLENAIKQIEVLSRDLADSNKSMIKLKATHKTKVKQMQKCIDDYTKVSDSNSELVRLQVEVSTLTQKIAELEDEKGNLQLHLVDYDSDRVSDSQYRAKLIEVESLAEERLSAIADLEMQKFDLVQELHLAKQTVLTLEDKVADLSFLENEHVSAELKCAQLEEQLDVMKAENKKILSEIDFIIAEKNTLLTTVELLNKDKSEMNTKLELYVQENMDLIDRLDKLSAEKVSSAESIEMVESLTSQEKMEIEQYQKTFNMDNPTEKDIDELKEEDNYSKLQTEKAELQARIDLFLTERQEVMEKIENLQSINSDLNLKLENLTHERKSLEEQYNFLKVERDNALEQMAINEGNIVSTNEKMEKILNENIILASKVENLTSNLSLKTEEVIVSETVEIEDTIEKEFVETPLESKKSQITSSQKKQKSPPQLTGPSAQESLKVDKKSTKEILRLKNILKQKETEINDLNIKLNEILDIRKQYEQLLTENKGLDDKFQQSLQNNASLNEQLLLLEQEKGMSSRNLQYLEENNSLLLSEKSSFDEIINASNEKIKLLEDDILQKNEDISIINCNLKKDHEMFKLQNENILKHLKSIIGHLNNTIKNNDNLVTVLEEDSNQFNTYSEKISYLCNELQEKVNLLDTILIENKRQIDDILREKESNIEIISQLQNECLLKNEEINITNVQLLEIKKSLSEKSEINLKSENEQSNRVQELEIELNNRSKIYNDLQQEFSELSLKLENEREKYDKLITSVENSKSDMSKMQSDYIKIEGDLQKSMEMNNVTKQEAVMLTCQIAEISSEKEKLLSTIDKCKCENENLLSLNTGLSTKLAEYDLQLKTLSQDNILYLEKLENKMAECENTKTALSKLHNLEDQLNSKQSEITDLIEQLENVRDSFNEFKGAHDAKIQERDVYIESLEIDLSKLRDKIIRLEESVSSMDNLKKKAVSLVGKLQKKNHEYSQILQLKNQLEERVTDLEKQEKLDENRILEVTSENSELLNKISDLVESKKKLELDYNANKLELTEIKTILLNLQDVEKIRISLAEKCNSLELELKNTTMEYSDVIKKKSIEYEYLETSLQAQNENFDIQIKHYKDECVKLGDEITSLNQRLKDFEHENEELRIENDNLISDKIAQAVEKENNYLKESNLMLECQKRDDEISKLNNQFKNCLSQLTELIEAEKFLKNVEKQHLSTIAEKESTISSLRNELSNLQTLQKPKDNVLIDDVIVKKAVLPSASAYFGQGEDLNMQDLKYLQDQIIVAEPVEKQSVESNETTMIRAFHHDQFVPVDKSQADILIQSGFPISDEIIQPKKAYVCFDDESQFPPAADTSFKFLELENTIKSLTDEKNKLSNDLSQNQIKLNKALLKLKEFKNKYDNINAEIKKLKASSNVDVLDSAIQDELYSQINNLEEKMKEMKLVCDKEKIEKEGLLKRIDVLTSANDKLVTMKEKQDIEMEICKTNNITLNNKLENLQWDTFTYDSENAPETVVNINKENINLTENESIKHYVEEIEKHVKKINDLEADNEEMLLLLEQQRKENRSLPQQNQIDDSQIANLNKEVISLRKIIDEKSEENNILSSKLNGSMISSLDYETKIAEMTKIVNSKDAILDQCNIENCDLKSKLEALVKEYLEFQETFRNNAMEKDEIELKYESMLNTLEELQTEKEQLFNLERACRTELSKIIYEKEELYEKYEDLNKKIFNSTDENETMAKEIEIKSQEISSIQLDLTNALKQVEDLKNHLSTRENDFSIIEAQLKKQIFNLEAQQIEISTKIENEYAQKNLSAIESNMSQIDQVAKELHETKHQLQMVICEKNEFKQTTESQILTELQKNESLTKQCNELKDALDEREMRLNNLNDEYNLLVNAKLELQKTIQLKETDLQKYYGLEAMCNNKFNEYNALFDAKDKELMAKIEELHVSHQAVESKNAEITELKHEIELLHQKNIDQMVNQVAENEARLSDLTHEKEVELASLRLKLHEERTQYESSLSEIKERNNYLENQLEIKIEECRTLNLKIEELQTLIDDETIQMGEMRSALENQEIEIVTLKEDISANAKAFEKLQRSERHVSFSEDTKLGDNSVVVSNSVVEEKVTSRADLDLALYMLHQRDVRCEELTVELVQLLEERDTLQLKLSNAIRINEELRYKTVPSQQVEIQHDPTIPVTLPQSGIPESANLSSTNTSRETSANSSTSVDSQQPLNEATLETKISQLHSVSQSRDVRLKDERESRQRQMELLQRDIQHLPPEAAAQLREAHYTLSRDTQSASTVLFNWLWGRTTPKVVHM